MRPSIAISYPSSCPSANPVKQELFAEIVEWADVALLDPHTEHPDLVNQQVDLYHMARQCRESLFDLRRTCRGGVQTVNPYDSVDLLSDRLRCLQTLQANGVRVPEYAYGPAEDIDLEPPVIIKPRYEIDATCHQLTTIRDGVLQFEGEKLVERYVNSQQHIKVHRLGDETRAVRGSNGSLMRVNECVTTRQITTIADRIQDLTRMNLLEIDLVGDGDLYVVDVNSAVSIEGIADGKQIYENLLRTLVKEKR